ncbi:hypothetical protein AVEN_108225-1 [Araneus ventricosus]|uniref:CCHC-type domain-containing protein n=1 Tax=Araneus ventricosus TaxID=182803 RepID=A0A4Y2RZ10_ARAVE|nr:hypothetical protein AVEN_108225-1 [Araneus ventricosus]
MKENLYFRKCGKRRMPDVLYSTTSVKLPEHIKAGYLRLAVKVYIPNPLRCFQCQRFGHSKSSCRGTLTCARCVEVGHDSTTCTAKEKCINCKGDHTSFSRNCFAWKQDKEIISTKIKNQISYVEARKIVKSKPPAAGNSYASAPQGHIFFRCDRLHDPEVP